MAPQKPEGAAGLSGEPSADCAAESPCMTATEIGKFVTKLLAALLFRRFIEPALEAAAGARWPASRQCKARSSKPRPTLYSKVGFGPGGPALPARSALTPQKILLLYILHLVLEFNPCTMVYSRMQTLGVALRDSPGLQMELNRCFHKERGVIISPSLRARERRPSAARMPPDDPFSVLGVRTDASVADVKTAYRSLGTHRP